MKRLSASQLLDIWENTVNSPEPDRSLYLLSVLYDTDISTVAAMSIGKRDTLLLKFRAWMFGSRLINTARCPVCNTPVEWEMATKDILLQEVMPVADEKVLKLKADGYEIDFRLPNSLDIIDALSDSTLAADPDRFTARCILKIKHERKEIGSDMLPKEILARISKKMNDEDPQANILMLLTCPECKHEWEATFDIMTYLWMEIDSWAKRLLGEVAALARVYKWSEDEILGLSRHRRKLYLEMIGI